MSIGIICVNCGKIINKNVCGSLRHPYCKKCFKKTFNNDYDKYNKFLAKTHG